VDGGSSEAKEGTYADSDDGEELLMMTSGSSSGHLKCLFEATGMEVCLFPAFFFAGEIRVS